MISDPNPFGDRERLGILEHEATALCPVCADIDCLEHTPDAPTSAELAMRSAISEIRKAKDAAEVVAAARACLDAWDAEYNLPKRIQSALSNLSDAMARMDKIPF